MSQAYASLLEQGEDPYTVAADPEPALGAAAGEVEEDEPEEADQDHLPEADHDAVCPITPRSILEAIAVHRAPEQRTVDER